MTTARDREAFDQAIVRGSEMLKQGKLGDAIRSFRQALDIEPDNQKVLALLGLTHFRANELDAARPIYEDLVELAPTDASHRLNLGLVYLKLNDAERAINSLEASRSLDPSQGRAVSYLGLAYARAGRYVEAYRSFLLAGQNELATEIEVNLTLAERDGILAQLGRPPGGPIARPTPPPEAPTMARTKSEPRTKPPGAPPSSRAKPFASEPSSTVTLGARTELPQDAVQGRTEREMSSIGIAMSGSGSISLSAAEALVPAKPPREFSSPEISIEGLGDRSSELPDRGANPMTVSQQFVLEPQVSTGVPTAAPGSSRVSMAVAAAAPSASATSATRTPSGGFAARALSELATEDLIRPDDGTDTLEIAPNGALLIRVTERVVTRLDGVHVTGGELAFEPATRRSRGHQTVERFDTFHVVSGKGYLIAAAPGGVGDEHVGDQHVDKNSQRFSAVILDDDILYLREDLVFAFEATLRWENGNVPGLRGKLHVVQFRGDGALAVRLARPLVRVKLPPSGLVFVDAERLAGWIGRVIPRAVVSPEGGPLGSTCVECTGEGIVLVEPAPQGTAVSVQREESGRKPPPAPAPLPPPEPPQPAEVAPEIADFAADLAAFNKAADAADADAAGTKPPDDESF